MRRTGRWWDRQPPRRQAVVRWGGPLLMAALVVGADWLWRHHQGVVAPRTARALLLRVGTVLAIAALVKLVFARRWPLQDLGHLLVILGVAGLFVRVIGRWGPQPVHEWERDLIQALLDVGAVTLLAGLVLWVALRYVPRSPPPEPSIERDEGTGVVYDRRSGRDRRSGWGKRE